MHAGADLERLHEPAELTLRAAVDRLETEITSHLSAQNPREALRALAAIRPDLDRFFTEVRVNVEDRDLREARLTLLDRLRKLILEIGDISHIAQKRSE
jgi:glycyl-tRNA synthetase beta chain